MVAQRNGGPNSVPIPVPIPLLPSARASSAPSVRWPDKRASTNDILTENEPLARYA